MMYATIFGIVLAVVHQALYFALENRIQLYVLYLSFCAAYLEFGMLGELWLEDSCLYRFSFFLYVHVPCFCVL